MAELEDVDYELHRKSFSDVLQGIRQVMSEAYGLKEVSVRPVGAGGARLSIPVKIEGIDPEGKSVRYFGKILGNSEIITSRTIQLFKNIYLATTDMKPVFGISKNAQDLARHQHESLKAIYDLGIPTAKPMGYYPLNGNLWLVVAEFLTAKPVSSVKEVNIGLLDTVFGYLRKMHKNNVYHGDIKPENIMIGDKVYIIDVGNLSDDADPAQKQAYDVACQVASFVGCCKLEEIVHSARRHYSRKELKEAAEYLDLIQQRPDIYLSEETKSKLLELMTK
jgi:tRNA A-37 threonylcarbamoyl transferase component Bud32